MGLELDGVEPARTIRATSVDDVLATVRAANERGEGLVPFGGATRLEVGNAPRRYDVALDLSALAGVVEHEAADLTATVRAGTAVGSLAEHLARHGQMWPPAEVGDAERATVGGVLAGAAAGPSRLAYFHPRDWTVGVRAVTGDGTLTRAGGKVVKNVTAYDLTRFYTGSYGTLCVLVEASLKLWPLPEAERTLVARFARFADAEAALDALRADRVALDAAVARDEPSLAGVRVRGTARAVARLVDRVARALRGAEEVAPAFWREVADAPHRALVVLRVTAPESRIRAALDGASPGVLHYHGTGIAFLLRERATVDWVRERRADAEAREGSCVIERAPADLKHAVDAWGAPALPLELARRIKAALDPNGVLSPGRYAGGL